MAVQRGVNMKVLKNKDYYVVIPKCDQAARTLIVYLLKSLYVKELKHAKMSSMSVPQDEKNDAGTLKRRSL